MKPYSLHSLISSLSCKCECLGIIHFIAGPFFACTSVLHIFTANRLRGIFSNWCYQLLRTPTPHPLFLSYQPTPLEEQFSTVALYDLVSHTQYYCNNGRPSIEIGGDALKCCVSMCSAVCLEISSRQFRCGYLDPDLHMCFARSALILLTFTREIQTKQTLSHYKRLWENKNDNDRK